MRRSFNFQGLLKTLICLSLSALLFRALLSGSAADYVHPRLNGYLWFAAFALLAIGLLLLPFAFAPRHRSGPAGELLFLIPLLSVLLIPAGAVQTKAISFGGAGAPAQSASSAVDRGTVLSDGSSSSGSSGWTGGTSPSSDSGLPTADETGVIDIGDDQFAAWYKDINADMAKYEGKTLRFKGQVFRMDGFAKNEIVPVRYAMVCCAADLQPCGILCRGDDVSDYGDNEWVRVTGTVKIEEFQGQTMPVCYVTKIEKAEKAKQEYIYFTY